MARQYTYYFGTTVQRQWWRDVRAQSRLRFMGRPRTAPCLSRHKSILSHGVWCDVTPAPGRTYTRDTWPPRGRGESLFSPRHISAKLRAYRVIYLHYAGYTFAQIAHMTGFKDGSGAYRAYRRTLDRIDWDRQRRAALRNEHATTEQVMQH